MDAHVNAASTSLSRDATPIVEKLRSRCGSDLESIIQFSFPFSKASHVLLVMLSAEVKSLSWVYEELWREIVEEDGLMCLRVSELENLSRPGPVVTTASIPYWVRETGRTLYGADLRHRIIVAPCSRLLSYHLDRLQSARHRILELLIQKEYEALDAHLLKERRSIMYAALFSRGIWHVSPQTVVQEFTAKCSDADLRKTAAESAAVSEALRRTPGAEQKALTYKAVWLFERFLLQLSKSHT